jgi:hypothetical protein
MSDLRDFTGKNRKFTGTIGERISTGTTAQRDDSTFGGGTIRFNSSTSLMEYYDGNQWKPIDSPPILSSVSPSTFVSDGSTIQTITVSGSNFSTTVIGRFIGNDGTIYVPGTVTRVSSSSVTMTTLTTMTVANEPYDIQITNISGLSGLIEDALDAGSSPAFTATAGTLGTLNNGNRAATALATQTFGPATDADNQQINYSITSGSLPPGLRLGTANDGNNGKILGTATAVVSNTTSTFTITASDGVNTASRQYSITVNAPVVTTFTSTGAFTYTVPSGVSAVRVLVVAGGGSTQGNNDGGGGGGGLIDMPSFPVTPGGSVSGTVGGGASAGGSDGQNSTFGSLTAVGGGGSTTWNTGNGRAGGSGGGAGGAPSNQYTGGTGNQPQQPGNSGTFGFGNPGGQGAIQPGGDCGGGGGGGAGQAGQPANPFRTGPFGRGGGGGQGRISDASGSNVYYAGGGGGGGGGSYAPQGSAPGGQGGGGNGGSGPGRQDGTSGQSNTGGGGGGNDDTPSGTSGGSGIVIVSI